MISNSVDSERGDSSLSYTFSTASFERTYDELNQEEDEKTSNEGEK
jgi:hypothetical protein